VAIVLLVVLLLTVAGRLIFLARKAKQK